jgi:hypothetical protein
MEGEISLPVNNDLQNSPFSDHLSLARLRRLVFIRKKKGLFFFSSFSRWKHFFQKFLTLLLLAAPTLSARDLNPQKLTSPFLRLLRKLFN